jgi:23S rRNA pseudouridine1911/1915/1917 synthase
VTHEPDRVYAFAIREKARNQRIDIFLPTQIKDLTRSRVQDLIKENLVQVNGQSQKASYRLKDGDRITIRIPPPKPYHLEPEPVEFKIIFEDQSLLVIDKPPGVVIHPAPGHPTGTLVHGLLQHCSDLSGIGGVLRPGIVHRLDKDTSGLMVVAKNDRIHDALSRQFKAGSVHKVYLALVHGLMDDDEGSIELPISRHPKRRKEMAVVPARGKKALTLWQKIETVGVLFSLLSVTPKTGRTHQIRVHLTHMGHPIVGDTVYGYGKRWWKKHLPHKEDISSCIRRQMLHAHRLGFYHPLEEDYRSFEAPLPYDMADAVRILGLFA